MDGWSSEQKVRFYQTQVKHWAEMAKELLLLEPELCTCEEPDPSVGIFGGLCLFHDLTREANIDKA